MRLLFIIVLLLGSFFAFSEEMEPGSEYYNLSVQLVTDISNLEFSACPDWTDSISMQEFLCADFSGDARNFPNVWDASLAQVINQYNLEDALDWSIGQLGINKMYSINGSIMSVTLEPQGTSSQLVIYVSQPLSFDDFATAATATTTTTSITTTPVEADTSLQPISIPLPQTSQQNTSANTMTNSLTSTAGSNIIIQAVPLATELNSTQMSSNEPNIANPNTASIETVQTSPSSNPTANFSDVTTSTVTNDFYGYPTYQAYVDAYRLKVTNPGTTSQALQTAPAASVGNSNSLPAYCGSYPSRPECNVNYTIVEQSIMPFPTNPVQQSIQQTTQQNSVQQNSVQQNSVQQNSVQQIQPQVQQQATTQSFNGYPSYEAYLQAFNQRIALETQNAQARSYTQNQSNSQQSQGFAGFSSYEAYLQDYNQRYGQAGQSVQTTAPTTAVLPTTTAPVTQTPQIQLITPTPQVQILPQTETTQEAVTPTTPSNDSSTSSIITEPDITEPDITETDTPSTNNSSSQFQVSASSLTGTITTPTDTTNDATSSTQTTSTQTTSTATSTQSNTTIETSNESDNASSRLLSLAKSQRENPAGISEQVQTGSQNGVLGKISTRGFRNVPWGSTPKRTKDIETWELVDEGLAKDEAYYLAYDGEVLGTKVLAVYYFSPKTKILGRGAYIFMGANEANSLQVIRHTSLHNMLGEDYGDPNRNEKLWLNDEARGLSDIDALETGDLLYVTQWDDEQIDVELSLFASADELMNRVLYSSKLFSIVIDEEIN